VPYVNHGRGETEKEKQNIARVRGAREGPPQRKVKIKGGYPYIVHEGAKGGMHGKKDERQLLAKQKEQWGNAQKEDLSTN